MINFVDFSILESLNLNHSFSITNSVLSLTPNITDIHLSLIMGRDV